MAVSVADVHEILDALQAVGADPRLTGGWGIDALVGTQTREHRDLDLAIRAEALEAAVAALQQRRFTVTTDWLPVRVELTCGHRHVDLHPLHYRADGSAWQSGLDQRVFDYPPHDWQIGHVGARPVVCLSPARQRLFQAGYDHSEKDRHDIALLDRVSAESVPPVSETSGK